MKKEQVLSEKKILDIAPVAAYGNKSIPVNQYGLDGKFIQSFPSINTASKATGIGLSSIILAVNGKFKQAGKFQWRKAD